MDLGAMFDLNGRVALVTGGSKGIGKAMCMGLARHGARVVVSSRKIDQCEAAVEEIRAAGGEAVAIAANAGKHEELEALAAKTRADLGPVDIVIGNAAVNP
ncbi:MAG: SDR family NAD(P)-dependent oxidoreductase, partial [Pseudomonadota bacterium]